jgi:hypothetical protein
MTALMLEVARFQQWAKAYPPGARFGEWECNYADWAPLYEAVLVFVRTRPFESWSAEELEAVLYAIARDNESQHLVGQIREGHAECLVPLAEAAVEMGEPDAKWQLAEELGDLGQAGGEAERLLVRLAGDGAEYVRRKAGQALARIGSASAEEVALAAWHRPDECQQWARMMALWCLHRVASPHLTRLLDDAERDERPYLSAYAKRIRNGEIEA